MALSYKQILAISFLLVAGLFAFSFLMFTAGFKTSYFTEDKLAKNSEFKLRPGDALAYEFSYLNATGTEAFLFGRQPLAGSNFTNPVYANCTLALLAGDNLSTCIYPDGTDGGGNQSLAGPFFFFSPWMLALSDSFSWKSELRNSITNEPIENFSAAVNGNATFLGRDAYVVDVNESGALGEAAKRLWIDKKTRIVLREEGENYTAEIIRAPFPLQQQAG
ncbi:Uncharacterised protein [uncultured archaeon]|nr:Uncharacterised protein [uncultured archaeon]